MPTNKSGLGYAGADKLDNRDLQYAIGNIVLDPRVPESVDFSEFVDPLSQGWLNSCVGMALVQGWRTIQRMGGNASAELRSAMFAWYNSKAQHGDAANNSGTFIRLAIKQANKIGMPPESIWPYDEFTFMDKPQLDAYRHAGDTKLITYRRIAAVTEARIYEIKKALAAGMPIIFGTDVSEEFVEYRGGGVVGIPTGKMAGGHAMLIVGYDADGVIVVNSWGKNWGDNGFARLSWEYMTWDRTRDLWALSA